MGSLFEAVVDLLEHGLAPTLKHRQHDALECLLVGGLDGALHGLSCCAPNGVSGVLDGKTTHKHWISEKEEKAR